MPLASNAPDEVSYISGRTRVYGIVGDPSAQVRSPEMFTAALRARGLDAILVPLHVTPEDFDPCLGGLLALRNLDGLIFTIPHTTRVFGFVFLLCVLVCVVGAIIVFVF